ncbi:MAG: UDP-N-acetylglucosamine 2-epimerase [Planctomycetota bacterium]
MGLIRPSTGRRKVAFICTSRTQYGRSKLLLKALKAHPKLELSVVVAGSALLPQYGDVMAEMKRDGIEPDERITMLVEGGSPVAMAKTTGLGLIEFTTAYENLQPDYVLIRGDRYEMLAAAIAASYLNRRIAHIEGGDVTGTIDESVRHAISKLAHLHFPTNDQSAQRLQRMGEDPRSIHNIGSLDVEYVASLDFSRKADPFSAGQKGLGPSFNLQEPYLVVMQHPVTSEYGSGRSILEATVEAVEKSGMNTFWFWPNIDAGNDELSKVLRVARENGRLKRTHFFRSLPAEAFMGLVQGSSCFVGNSSAGIKECSYLGVPVVNIGTRQQGRLRSPNVVDVGYEASAIAAAIQKQCQNGRYASSTIYFKPDSSRLLADLLATEEPPVQKRFVE